ncbi:MAG: hypothetical protein H8E26_01950 [FCB group bacterium]|nr:hypothetical protein [FCB group bacterium]MBL7029484.1 hypothetical protein [Candidatus Neomarinimicrobiota bacterium]MBL7123067.1 hypothetical protein [Candidatus Neomarinimicrobiota bacterium]
MKHHNPQSGFSLIDMIMGLSIIALAIVGIQYAQRNYIELTSQVETSLRAVSLGNSVMNTIRMHAYDEGTASPWSSTIGPDAGESTITDYDDIDDYAAAAWDFSNDGYSGFNVISQVFYVQVPSNWLDSLGTRTNYKRIIVTVNHSALNTPVVFTSIMAGVDR